MGSISSPELKLLCRAHLKTCFIHNMYAPGLSKGETGHNHGNLHRVRYRGRFDLVIISYHIIHMISLINEYQRNIRNSIVETEQRKNQNTMDLTIAGISSLMVFITCWVTRNSSELIWVSSGLKKLISILYISLDKIIPDICHFFYTDKDFEE